MIRRFFNWMFVWPSWVPFKARAFVNSYCKNRDNGCGIVVSVRSATRVFNWQR